jgi:hypothetical protein
MPTYFALSGNDLTINAQTNSQSRNYIMKLTHSTIDHGPINFNTITIQISVCEITDLDPPTAPSGWWHYVFNGAGTIDMSGTGFVQRPACGYTLIEDFTWTIPAGAPMAPLNNPTTLTSPDVYSLVVESTTPGDRRLYTVALACTATYYTTGVQYSSSVSFELEVKDPCNDSNALTPFTITDVAVEAGLTAERTFNEPTDTQAVALSQSTMCGARSYQILEVIGGIENSQSIVTY